MLTAWGWKKPKAAAANRACSVEYEFIHSFSFEILTTSHHIQVVPLYFSAYLCTFRLTEHYLSFAPLNMFVQYVFHMAYPSQVCFQK